MTTTNLSEREGTLRGGVGGGRRRTARTRSRSGRCGRSTRSPTQRRSQWRRQPREREYVPDPGHE